ncbi:MAG TPA: hypothetical protein VFI04_01805 [Gaiellaceae bacterium]|jgi:hypothetical protein|nr:hypothetical protein [Gaiellaceae bacterium]
MIWIAAAFCLVAVVGSLAYAALRGFRLWRTSRAVSRRATDAIAAVTESAARTEERARGLTEKTERLTAATERLHVSLVELAAIRRAVAEPQALLRSLRGTVPRK